MGISILRDTPLLRHFLAVATDGSISAACARLAVTQPALTKSIQRLEAQLGVKLFERLPRGMALTPFGKTLLPHARRIEAECHFAEVEMQAFRGGRTGTPAGRRRSVLRGRGGAGRRRPAAGALSEARRRDHGRRQRRDPAASSRWRAGSCVLPAARGGAAGVHRSARFLRDRIARRRRDASSGARRAARDSARARTVSVGDLPGRTGKSSATCSRRCATKAPSRRGSRPRSIR